MPKVYIDPDLAEEIIDAASANMQKSTLASKVASDDAFRELVLIDDDRAFAELSLTAEQRRSLVEATKQVVKKSIKERFSVHKKII